jgi:hypothetical protein
MNITMTPPRRHYRPSSTLVELGIWVAHQAALGRLDWEGCRKVYEETGQSWPSNPQQISKLRVFYHFGKRHGAKGALWLDGHQHIRKAGESTYTTLVDNLRKLNKRPAGDLG